MTRAILSIVLCGGCLALGLWTTHVQAENHARAAYLDEVKRKCDLIQAGNESLKHSISVIHGQIERELLAGHREAFEE